MRNTQAQPEPGPAIDLVLNDRINALAELGDVLFAAHYGYQETQSATQRAAQCAAFAQAVYDLDGIVTYLQNYLAQMRDGVTRSQPGRVIRPRCWSQPRDARGRFITGNTSSVSGPGTIGDGLQKRTAMSEE